MSDTDHDGPQGLHIFANYEALLGRSAGEDDEGWKLDSEYLTACNDPRALSKFFIHTFVGAAVRRHFDDHNLHDDDDGDFLQGHGPVDEIMRCIEFHYRTLLNTHQQTLENLENTRRRKIRHGLLKDIFADIPKHIDTISFLLVVIDDFYAGPIPLYCGSLCQTPSVNRPNQISFGCGCSKSVEVAMIGDGRKAPSLPPSVVKFLNHMNVTHLSFGEHPEGEYRLPTRVTLYRPGSDNLRNPPHWECGEDRKHACLGTGTCCYHLDYDPVGNYETQNEQA